MDQQKPAAPLVDLDSLLTRALARQTPKKERRKPTDMISSKEIAEADRRMKERFTLPENWERVRTVALVHEESQTLLGNFAEYKHKLSSGCRKLIRVSEPAKVDEMEMVAGSHWLNPEPLQASKPEGAAAEEVREAIVDLHMPEMDNVFSPSVMVSVVLHWGSVARVELTDETRFFSKDKRVQLILPEGLDVREGLSLETKLRIKEFLGL